MEISFSLYMNRNEGSNDPFQLLRKEQYSKNFSMFIPLHRVECHLDPSRTIRPGNGRFRRFHESSIPVI